MIRLKIRFIYLVIYLAAAFCSCGPRNLQIDYFPVDEVLNGSQVKLRNGYIVNLLGVSDGPEAKDYLDKNVLNKKIRFAFDSHSPFYKLFKNAKSKSIYAYAIMEDGVCINSVLAP
ncbi:MAG: hypothetical protein IPI10_14075 [Bacteroidetes bacterium]|nr:hypothetical protein [Bacteroidota bacterium]